MPVSSGVAFEGLELTVHAASADWLYQVCGSAKGSDDAWPACPGPMGLQGASGMLARLLHATGLCQTLAAQTPGHKASAHSLVCGAGLPDPAAACHPTT